MALDTIPTCSGLYLFDTANKLINGWLSKIGRLHIETQFPIFSGVAEDLVAIGVLSYMSLIREAKWWWPLWIKLFTTLPTKPYCLSVAEWQLLFIFLLEM